MTCKAYVIPPLRHFMYLCRHVPFCIEWASWFNLGNSNCYSAAGNSHHIRKLEECIHTVQSDIGGKCTYVSTTCTLQCITKFPATFHYIYFLEVVYWAPVVAVNIIGCLFCFFLQRWQRWRPTGTQTTWHTALRRWQRWYRQYTNNLETLKVSQKASIFLIVIFFFVRGDSNGDRQYMYTNNFKYCHQGLRAVGENPKMCNTGSQVHVVHITIYNVHNLQIVQNVQRASSTKCNRGMTGTWTCVVRSKHPTTQLPDQRVVNFSSLYRIAIL